MNRTLVYIGGILLLVAIAFYCVRSSSPVIQQELTTRLTDLYKDQRINWVEVSVDGRDVTLSGEAPSNDQMLYALEMAESQEGARIVFNRQTVMSRIITTPLTTASDFSTNITLKDGKVSLNGHVPDEESRDLLLVLAQAQFGESAVVDNLSVAPGAPDDWRQVISAVLMNLAGFKEVAAAISPGKLMLEGVARDRQAAELVRNHVNESLPKTIQPQLSIRLAEPTEMQPAKQKDPQTEPSDSQQEDDVTPKQETPQAETALAVAETASDNIPATSMDESQEAVLESPDVVVASEEPQSLAGMSDISQSEPAPVGEEQAESSASIAGSSAPADSGMPRPYEAMVDASVASASVPALADQAPETVTDITTVAEQESPVAELAGETDLAEEETKPETEPKVADSEAPSEAMTAVEATVTETTESPEVAASGEKTEAVAEAAVSEAESPDPVSENELQESVEAETMAGKVAKDDASETQPEQATVDDNRQASQQIEEVQPKVADAAPAEVVETTETASDPVLPAEELILVDTTPEDEEEKSRCLASINAMLEGKRINFRFDSTYIHNKHNGMLDKIVAVAILCPEVVIEVEGHTDSLGPISYNQQLSERRAKSGASALNNRGIWKEQLTSIGYGELRPIASNRTRAGRAKNRRIEFKVKETQ